MSDLKVDDVFSNMKARPGRQTIERGPGSSSSHQSPERQPNQRANLGNRNGQAKLTEDRVREARAAHASWSRIGELAKQFGVTPSTMSMAVSGRTWVHV